MAINTVVVLRQLMDHRPVTSFVYTLTPTEFDSIDQGCEESYLKAIADDHIQKFQKQFVEFAQAEWYTDFFSLPIKLM